MLFKRSMKYNILGWALVNCLFSFEWNDSEKFVVLSIFLLNLAQIFGGKVMSVFM